MIADVEDQTGLVPESYVEFVWIVYSFFLVYINNTFYLGIRCEKKNKAKPLTVSRKCTLATLKRYTNKVNVVPNYKYRITFSFFEIIKITKKNY